MRDLPRLLENERTQLQATEARFGMYHDRKSSELTPTTAPLVYACYSNVGRVLGFAPGIKHVVLNLDESRTSSLGSLGRPVV